MWVHFLQNNPDWILVWFKLAGMDFEQDLLFVLDSSDVLVKDLGVSLPSVCCMLGKAQRLWAWNRMCWYTTKKTHKLSARMKTWLFVALSSVPVWEVGGLPRVGSDHGAGGGGVRPRRQTVFTTDSRGRPRHHTHHPSAVTWPSPAASKTGTAPLTAAPLSHTLYEM